MVPELIDIRVACLNMEGPYKDDDHVTLTTTAYRDAVYQAIQAANSATSSAFLSMAAAVDRGSGR